MKIEVRFECEDGDEDELRSLDGKVIRSSGAKIMQISTSIDIFPDGEGGKLPGNEATMTLITHGPRPIWSEGE